MLGLPVRLWAVTALWGPTLCNRVCKYAMEFDLNTSWFVSLDEATLMQFFIWGLHRGIVAWVSIMHPTSLSQAK